MPEVQPFLDAAVDAVSAIGAPRLALAAAVVFVAVKFRKVMMYGMAFAAVAVAATVITSPETVTDRLGTEGLDSGSLPEVFERLADALSEGTRSQD